MLLASSRQFAKIASPGKVPGVGVYSGRKAMRYVLPAALLVLSMQASAEIYKWTDAQGQVHFDQRPVSGASQVQVKPQVIENDEATRQRQERTDTFYKARRDEQAQAEQRAGKRQAEIDDYCGRLRYKLAKIRPGSTYYAVNEQGEREYLSDQQMDAARRQLGQQIAQDCD
jgi:hypothetical protein